MSSFCARLGSPSWYVLVISSDNLWYSLHWIPIPLSPSNISPNSHRFSNVFLAFFFPNDGFVDLEVSPNTSKYIFVGPVNSVKPPMIPTWICQGTWEARSGPGVALVFENVIFPAAITSGYTPQTHTHTHTHLVNTYVGVIISTSTDYIVWSHL